MFLADESYDKNALADLDDAITAAKKLINERAHKIVKSDMLGDLATEAATSLKVESNIEEQEKLLEAKIDKFLEQLFLNSPLSSTRDQLVYKLESSLVIEPSTSDPEILVINYYHDSGIKLTELNIQIIASTRLGPVFISELDVPAELQITDLDCSNIDLSILNEVPNSLECLECSNNQLVSLPTMPTGLKELNCGYNQLESLPELPPSLKHLTCMQNEQLGSLPALPNSLVNLTCYGCPLEKLPQTLPENLKVLNCSATGISELPALPDGMLILYCVANNLTTLPSLPASLEEFHFMDNNIQNLPDLPDSLKRIEFDNNPLSETALSKIRIHHGGFYVPA